MDEILEVLPGEGTVETITRRRVRVRCEKCGGIAVYRYTYLLLGFRRNPASKAYGKDDCSWCCDTEVFTCATCKPMVPEGHDRGASTFPASARFAHMFLEWERVKP